MRMRSIASVLVVVFVCCAMPSSGQQDEIAALKKRVAELEQQNRAILEALAELKAQRGSLQQPAAAPTPSAPAKPQTATGAEPVRWPEIVSPPNRLKFYGLMRLDIDIDSQRASTPQIPFFITSEDPQIGKAHAGAYSMHPRLTRLGVDLNGPRLAALKDAALGGKLEMDFENGGSESRQIIRIRHAYLQTRWNSLSLLAGQTWDIVSPLFPTVNNDALMWNAGNPGDRRPQLRVSWEPKTSLGAWSFVGGAGLTSAVDLGDLDNNGFRDGEESGRPDVQARIGYSRSLFDQSASVGVSLLYGWMNTSKPAGGRTDFASQLVNLDYTLPMAPRVSLRGEGWWGRNLSDIRGGAGQGIHIATGREIRARGGWSELTLKLSRYWSLHPGFTLDEPVASDVPMGGRTRNGAFYLGNRITPGGSFLLGADYLRWRTDYKGFRQGIDNRVNLFVQYGF